MQRKILTIPLLFFSVALPVFLMGMAGCHPGYLKKTGESPPAPVIHKVVVVGFGAVRTAAEKPGVVRGPISGSVYAGGPVPGVAARIMTDALFDRMVESKKYQLISPGQAKGVSSSILDSDECLGVGTVRLLQKIGKAFGADAVLAGHIYRWQERAGTDYAVNRPASVAFDLHMIRPEDGRILWKGKFDKTQRSLSENLLDWAIFRQGRGRWMTVEELALYGLGKMLKEMPGGREGGEEKKP